MNIVLLESLGITDAVLEQHVQPLRAAGHAFAAYPKTPDVEQLKQEAKDADILMLANMPLALAVLEQAKALKFIDVAFTGVDHIPMEEAKRRGIAVSNANPAAKEAADYVTVSNNNEDAIAEVIDRFVLV